MGGRTAGVEDWGCSEFYIILKSFAQFRAFFQRISKGLYTDFLGIYKDL